MNWDDYFLGICDTVSSKSKDPSTKVGACIANSLHQILAAGFNGIPRKVKDLPERLNDRAIKLEYTLHAEINAFHNRIGSVEGCTLYVNSLPPCFNCALNIVQAGIVRVVYPDTAIPDRWWDSCNKGLRLFEEAGVEAIAIKREPNI